eukprot:1184842-Alexandrium_andersonii.AAC.1
MTLREVRYSSELPTCSEVQVIMQSSVLQGAKANKGSPIVIGWSPAEDLARVIKMSHGSGH